MDKLVSYKSIHFIGIGGVSMKALAKYCRLRGVRVSGSDIRGGSAIERLAEEGIEIVDCDDIECIGNCDLVVYTAAIPSDNLQLVAAKELRIPVMERKAFLGLVSRGFNKVISVAGTHGKTTCTAMISSVFDRAEMPYTGHIGGDLQGKECNLICRGDDYFVTEACEYNRSFHTLSSDIALILNVGFDHPDCYKDMDDMVEAYNSFVRNCKAGATVIIYGEALPRIDARGYNVVTFGYGRECDYYPERITYKEGRYSFFICGRGERLGKIDLPVYGKHNILNALAAFACSIACGIDAEVVCAALSEFCGVKGRFEKKGVSAGGAQIIYDYAHHPDEISATVDTARVFGIGGKIIAVFEPHTFSRTKSLINEFSASFAMADEIIILPTFKAREDYIEGGAAYDLYVAVSKKGYNVKYACDYEKAARLLETAEKGDVILLMGAGTVSALATYL